MRDVAQVWVAGEPVVARGRVLGVDIAELLPHARELAVKLATDAGLDSELARPSPPAGGAVTITLPDTDAVAEDGYVPVISLAGLDDPSRRAEVAAQLGAALRRSGFYIAVDHIVPLPVFDQLTAAALEFFHQPEEEKARYGPSPDDATRRGFTSRYRAASGIGVNTDEDAAEAWALNPYDEGLGWRDLSVLEPKYRAAFVHPNRIPDTPGFRSAALSYFAAMESQIFTLLSLHALDLGLPPDHFTRLCAGAMTNLVVNHYPPQRKDPLPDQSCLGPHTDLGVMTGLLHSGQKRPAGGGPGEPERAGCRCRPCPAGSWSTPATCWCWSPAAATGPRCTGWCARRRRNGSRCRSSCSPGRRPWSPRRCARRRRAPGFEPVRFGEYFAERIGMMYAEPEH